MPERKIEYQRLSHTADTGFRVEAPSWQRLYIDAALALTDLRVPLDLVREQERRSVSVTADDRESLMVKWLTEILFLFEKEKVLCKRIVFNQFTLTRIDATLWGDIYESTRHGSVSEIKAVTYHQMQIGEADGPEPRFFARIFLDL